MIETTYHTPVDTYQCGVSMGWPAHDGIGWRCFERAVFDVTPWSVGRLRLVARTFKLRRDIVMGVK